MKAAKAQLTFEQIGLLIEGKPVTIRLPDVLEPVPGQAYNVTRTVPGIDIEINREPISRDTVVEYVVTCKSRPRRNIDLRITFMDKVLSDFGDNWDGLLRDIAKIFGLRRSK